MAYLAMCQHCYAYYGRGMGLETQERFLYRSDDYKLDILMTSIEAHAQDLGMEIVARFLFAIFKGGAPPHCGGA